MRRSATFRQRNRDSHFAAKPGVFSFEFVDFCGSLVKHEFNEVPMVCVGLDGSFERHRHAEGESFFPFADLPFPFEPSVIAVEWSGLQVAADALFQRKQGVP